MVNSREKKRLRKQKIEEAYSARYALFKLAPQVDTVEGAEGEFGFSPTNPIPVCNQAGQMEYLSKLHCRCGTPFLYHRSGSFGSCPDGHIVDCYELVCMTRIHKTVLFLDMYHEGSSSLHPDGMTVGLPEGTGLPFHIENFPEGLEEAFANLS